MEMVVVEDTAARTADFDSIGQGVHFQMTDVAEEWMVVDSQEGMGLVASLVIQEVDGTADLPYPLVPREAYQVNWGIYEQQNWEVAIEWVEDAADWQETMEREDAEEASRGDSKTILVLIGDKPEVGHIGENWIEDTMHRVGMEEVDDLVRMESPISSRLVDVNLEEVVKVTAHAVP
jgi:hypothetical protein